AVEDDGAASVGQFCERRFEQRCAINAVPAQQLQPAIAADDGYEPVPVVLRLVEPVLSLRRLRAGRDDLQTDVARHVRRNSVAWKRRQWQRLTERGGCLAIKYGPSHSLRV